MNTSGGCFWWCKWLFSKIGQKKFKTFFCRGYVDINLSDISVKKLFSNIFLIKKFTERGSYTLLNILIQAKALMIKSITESFVMLKENKCLSNIVCDPFSEIILVDYGAYMWPRSQKRDRNKRKLFTFVFCYPHNIYFSKSAIETLEQVAKYLLTYGQS